MRISIPALEAAQAAIHTAQAGRKVDDARMEALAGASAASSAGMLMPIVKPYTLRPAGDLD